jgi:hypothetical protein
MNAVVEHKPAALLPSDPRNAVAEVIAHTQLVQQVLKDVMKEGIHFGTIPGTDKPTLLQPGADVLAMTFRIAHELESEDLSTTDVVRYRVKCRGRHQLTGVVLGEGVGECSGAEEKYRWRRAVCDEEFDELPATHKRVKFAKGKNNTIYRNKQVRTEPADAANTVLKMAVKRAKIAMVLNVTGAGAVFGQDLEDLSDELRAAFNGQGAGGGQGGSGDGAGEPTAAQLAVRTEAKAAVAAAKTLDDLKPLAKTFVPKFKASGDPAGYDLFAEELKNRGAAIRAAMPPEDKSATGQAETQAPAAAPAPAEAPAASGPDPWLEEMAAAEASAKPAAGGADA